MVGGVIFGVCGERRCFDEYRGMIRGMVFIVMIYLGSNELEKVPI